MPIYEHNDYLDGSDWGEYDELLSKKKEWAEDHGYISYTCPKHGTFWSDTGEGCPLCPDVDELEN